MKVCWQFLYEIVSKMFGLNVRNRDEREMVRFAPAVTGNRELFLSVKTTSIGKRGVKLAGMTSGMTFEDLRDESTVFGSRS